MNWISAFRKELHRQPEISGEEENTAQKVAAKLREFSPNKIITNLGGHGVAAVFGSDAGKTIMVRCELDALPIKEINNFSHSSEIAGKSHMCGHDGHMSIVLGLAEKLKNEPLKNGRVVLLFQPAEENGEGAQAVLADEKFTELIPDFAVALHNLPGVEKHKILCKTGSFTPSVRSIIIKLHGKTAHAGEPDMGINPALAIAQITERFLKMQRPKSQPDFMQLTPIQIEMGEEAFGISAGYGEVKFTIRTWDDLHMDELVKNMLAAVEEISQQHMLKTEIEWTQFFAANQNHEEVVDAIALAAKNGGFEYEEMQIPQRWGEDFGLFTAKFKGAMFGLGAGKNVPALHNPDYDFPDEIAETGIEMFYAIAKNLLK